MRRRHFVHGLALGTTAWSTAAGAQQPRRIHKIGWLANATHAAPDALAIWDSFRLELQRLGWTEGQQVSFVQRFADGDGQRYPALVRDLVESKVDVIVATGGIGAPVAARNASASIPIVFTSVPDPVEAKLVASLARPGGNVTGLTTLSIDLISKRLELLRDAFPKAERVAYLSTGATCAEASGIAAAKLGLKWQPVRVTRAEEIVGAIAGSAGVDAWFVEEHTLSIAWRTEIVSAIALQRKPAVYPIGTFVRSGGLMSYGVDFVAQSRRAAWFVDRILRGARPAELPVERPNKFEMVLNLKAARAQDLDIARAILLRADEIIE